MGFAKVLPSDRPSLAHASHSRSNVPITRRGLVFRTRLVFKKLGKETMLVLSRKSSETIHVGDNIVIHVLKVRGAQVKLGIEAPADVTILRSELTDGTDANASVDSPREQSDSETVGEEYDDVAGVFAHPQSNQDRTRPTSAIRASRKRSARSSSSTSITMSRLASAAMSKQRHASGGVDAATAS